jgi:DNA polymerase-3 subunit alpha/error-prone DNA polymerase
MGYEHLALTDGDNLYGLWPFLEACRREGLRPIVGAEVSGDAQAPGGALCLVENEAGYRSLCRLITRRHRETRFDLAAALEAEHRGLVVLTADPGLLERGYAAGATVAAAMARHPLAADRPLRQAARRLGVPLVATPGAVFLDAGQWPLHRLLRAIGLRRSLSGLGAGDAAPAEAFMPSPTLFARRFAACPEALAATRAIAERLVFAGPRFGTVMPPPPAEARGDAPGALRRAAYDGARRRYGAELGEAVVERLERELAVIGAMDFAGYFLAVRDIVRLSPRTCGRGSGAASLVAYCLGITNVCPLKHDLYFERFLNPGRRDPPDIDVDFAWDERDGVIAAVLDGAQGHAAMVASHIPFQPRSALRETARVFGLGEAEIGRLTRRLPWFWRTAEAEDGGMLGALQRQPETAHLDLPPPWPEILQLAQRLIGLPRHLSVHPGGVVITPQPIRDYVPLETAAKGVPVIQWEKDGAEAAGLVKIDLLGNRSLAVIRDALALLRANGVALAEGAWEPEGDFATQQAIALGRTMGCFYIESPAMRQLQQKAGVGDFAHLVIHSSIIRPAANDYIREYLRRLHGGPWEPLHPLLQDVLAETFGIMVYQEDVSRAAVALAGFSHVEADGLRKILSKKDRGRRLEDCAARFAAGAAARGVAADTAAAVWRMILSFDGYSFCKPHSASYARVSFQAAYLKVHHGAEFMAAVIGNGGGFYDTPAYVSEARRMGLRVLGPDVNRSAVNWTGGGRELRVGLTAVRGLTAACAGRITAARGACPFRDPEDFMRRAAPEEGEARALVLSGALDALAPGCSRAELLWCAAAWRRRREARSPALFDAAAPPPRLPPGEEREWRRRELAVLGFLCDRHPITLWAEALAAAGALPAAELSRRIGRRVRVAGWPVSGKVVHTRAGEAMEFLTFEDQSAIFETTFFPATYRRFCHLLEGERPYLLEGQVESDWGAVTLTVERLAPL